MAMHSSSGSWVPARGPKLPVASGLLALLIGCGGTTEKGHFEEATAGGSGASPPVTRVSFVSPPE